jgi:hypothetical protein
MKPWCAYWLGRLGYRIARWAHAIDTEKANAAWRDVWADDFEAWLADRAGR